MKEMIYGKGPASPVLLVQGEHKGLRYFVVSFGTHPCAYVDATGTWAEGLFYDDMNISCHGGLTFSSDTLDSINETAGRWYIGWDYAHYGDYMGWVPEKTGKKWTTAEMVEECISVIDQIVDGKGAGQ